MLDGRKLFVNLGDVLSLRDKIIFKFNMNAFVSHSNCLANEDTLPIEDSNPSEAVFQAPRWRSFYHVDSGSLCRR